VPWKPSHASSAILFQKRARISSLSGCDLWGQALQPDENAKVKGTQSKGPVSGIRLAQKTFAPKGDSNKRDSNKRDSLTESKRNGRLK
jgi:hypothetical protein